MRLRRRREEVHLTIPRPGRDHHLVLEEDAKVVAHTRVVQTEELCELLSIPRFFPDGADDVPADRSPDAAPKEPPKEATKAVHADRRSQTDAVSSTFPSPVDVGRKGKGGRPRSEGRIGESRAPRSRSLAVWWRSWEVPVDGRIRQPGCLRGMGAFVDGLD